MVAVNPPQGAGSAGYSSTDSQQIPPGVNRHSDSQDGSEGELLSKVLNGSISDKTPNQSFAESPSESSEDQTAAADEGDKLFNVLG
jgi:hypothetical protein